MQHDTKGENMEEIWKDVQGYEGLYQVSNHGRIKSLPRLDSMGRQKGGLVLKPKSRKDGYKRINLYYKGKMETYLVHRIVANAFIPNPYVKPQVNHIDEDKSNNKVNNLVWMTAKENINYGSCIERSVKNRDQKSIAKKVDHKAIGKNIRYIHSKKVVSIDKDGNKCLYDSLTDASNATGLWRQNIGKCCKNIYKTSGGFHWKFID